MNAVKGMILIAATGYLMYWLKVLGVHNGWQFCLGVIFGIMIMAVCLDVAQGDQRRRNRPE